MTTQRPRPKPEARRQKPNLLPCLWLVPVFAVKALVLAQLGGHPLLQPHGELDTAYYVELAQRVAAGGPLAVREPFFVSPLYVYFLAAVFRLGGSLFAARLVQVLLGTAAVALVFRTTHWWFGRRAAWLSAALATATGLFSFYEILILQAALDPFLVAAALYLVSRTQWRPARWTAVAAGVALGLLALNRPNALAYAACAVVLVAVADLSRHAGAVRTAAGLIAGILLVLLPNAARNYAVSGEPILVSSHGGLNFYIGNHEGADGTYQLVPGVSPSIAGQVGDSTRVAEAAAGRRLSAGEVSDYFYARALDWIRREPTAAASLFARKLAMVFNAANVPLNFSYAYYSRDEASLLHVLGVGPWLLVPLGVAGLLLRPARRRPPQAAASHSGRGSAGASHSHGDWLAYAAWASFVPVYALSVAAFFVSSRYRMPLLVPLCVSSAATLAWGWERVRARDVRALVLPAAAVLALSVVVSWDLHLDDGRGGERTRRAVWLVEEGRIDEAIAYVRDVSADHSHPGVLRFKVGEALASAGRFDVAVPMFEEALAIDRGQPALQLALGQALVVLERSAEALPHLRAAYDAGFKPEVAAPWLARALALSGRADEARNFLQQLPLDLASAGEHTAFDLGTIALDVRATSEAIRWLGAAVARAPGHAEAQGRLGAAWLLEQRPDRALGPLEAACRLAPADATARLNLAVTYAQLGRIPEARATAEAALRLDPDEPRTRDLLNALGR